MIELRNINFRYAGGTDAGGLVNIDLIIPDGQVILLCGQSGCGKTTLTRLVNGLIPNYYEGELSGEVLLDGKNISGLPLYETAKYVGSVFQNPRTQFFTVDSTSELAFGCENQGLPEEEIIQRVKSTAKQFDMDNLLGKNIFSLSGGEKQKIACASVSASNPPIIVLDEPSSNLDMSATKDLRRMIQIWKQQGKTVIIAEHRLYYLKELIDRVVYLKDGKIEKDYSALDALKLSVTQQAEMGLRPFDLGAFPVTAHPVASRSSIECENFHFAYTKQRDALDIDSLSLPQAGVIAVIGHNGAGKSTLARCLCGLEKHCKGIVKVDGKPYNRKQRLSLCYMVMQDVNHQLFTESTEEEMLISMAEPSPDKADAVPAGTIGGTYCGNPLACAASLKTIEIMERDHLAERSCEIGKKVTERYLEMQKKYPVIGDVRGLGGMIGIEFVKDQETKEPDAAFTSDLIQTCAKKGLLVEGAGTYNNVIRFLAPLVMTDEQLAAGLDIFEASIKECLKH